MVHVRVINLGMDIGQTVQVYRLRDRVSKEIIDKLGKTGRILEFKMTDGSGIGVVVEFDDKSTNWFFEDEIKPIK